MQCRTGHPPFANNTTSPQLARGQEEAHCDMLLNLLLHREGAWQSHSGFA